MNMNRLRNVAVRMRPKAPGDGSESPTDGPGDRPRISAGLAPSPPRNAAISAPRAAPRRNIWDLEESGEPDMRAPHPTTAPLPAREAAPAPAPISDPAPAPVVASAPASAARDRPKTRILGFHAQDIAADGDAGPEQAAPGPVYPAGFLVVVDGPGRGAFFAVTTRVSTIGRGGDQDIALDFGDENISRSGHASVMYDPEQNRFFLGHGNKANVVRRNGTPVLATEELADGDTIRIGKTTLRFSAFCGADFTWEADEDGGIAHD